jgi:hypothetical protein
MQLTFIKVLILHKWLSFSNTKPIHLSKTLELQLCCKSNFLRCGRTTAATLSVPHAGVGNLEEFGRIGPTDSAD